jgi:hypothetical protein
MMQPASQIFSQGTSQYTMTDGSLTNTTNGMNVKTKKYKRLKLARSDTGQPHDPARFDGAKHKKKDVPQGPEKKGFGILGGHIDIKDHDPRIRPKAAARAVSALQGVGVSVELQMGSLEQLPDGGILGADGYTSHADGTGLDTHGSVTSLLTSGTAAHAAEGAEALAHPSASQEDIERFADFKDDLSVGSVGSQVSETGSRIEVLSMPASIGKVSVNSRTAPQVNIGMDSLAAAPQDNIGSPGNL